MSFFENLLNKQKDVSLLLLDLMNKSLSFSISMQEDVKTFIDTVKTKAEGEGEEKEDLMKDITEQVSKKKDELLSDVSGLFDKALEKMNIPSKEEMDKLNRKVQSLSAKLKKMEEPISKGKE